MARAIGGARSSVERRSSRREDRASLAGNARPLCAKTLQQSKCYRYKGLVFPERALDDQAGMAPYGTGHRGSEVVRRAKIFSQGRSSVPRRECQTLVRKDTTTVKVLSLLSGNEPSCDV